MVELSSVPDSGEKHVDVDVDVLAVRDRAEDRRSDYGVAR
jgi:hypothetical protein